MRAFDEAGDVDGDEGSLFVEAHDSELRFDRREGIVGDLRARRGDHREQRRFSRVRYTDDADVGEELEFEANLALFAGLTANRVIGCLPRRRRKMLVAEAALPAARDEHALAGLREIGEERLALRLGAFVDERSDGHGDDEVLAGAPRLVRGSPGLARFGGELALETKFYERVQFGIGEEIEAAAVPAVTAGGAALGNVFLAAPRDDAVAAAAGGDFDSGFVDKLHVRGLFRRRVREP